MKKFLTIILFLLCLASTCESIEAKRVYAELIGESKGFSTKLIVAFNYGQESKKESNFLTENGKFMDFTSMAVAMNYVSQFGWDFVQAYVTHFGDTQYEHWIIVKEVDNDEQINEGITTISDLKKKK